MSKRYPGNFITGNPVALSQTSNNGIWDLKDQYQAHTNGTWQEVDGIYEIPRSLRFRAANQNYLSRTFGTPTNNKVWTWSAWVKRGSLSLADANHLFLASPTDVGGNPSTYARLVFETDGTLRLQSNASAGELFTSSALFRDPSAWYHIVLYMDAVNTTVRCYVNGTEITYASKTNPTNTNTAINGSGNHHRMGFFRTAEPRPLDGYMAEANFIDGQALDPSYFGYTDSITGIWQPKKYTGAYGNNGFYLNFSDNSHAVQTLGRNFGVGSNYTAYSETCASWQTLNNVSVTSNTHIAPNVYAPAGTPTYLTADTVTATSASAGIYIYHGNSVSVSTPFTASMWFKAGTVSVVTMSEGHTSGAYASFSLTGNGAVTGSGTGATNANITPAGNGWYRCSFTYVTGGAQNTWGFRFEPRSTYGGAGSVGDSVIAWGAQLNFGVTIGPYNPSTSSFPTNDWLATNFSITAGATYDSMVDSPTNIFTSATDIGGVVSGNYCTWNSVDKSPSATLSSANLNITPGFSTQTLTRATMSIPSGAWYFEVTCTGEAGDSSAGEIGFSTSSAQANDGAYLTWAVNSILYTGTTGNKSVFGSSTSYGETWGTGAVIGVAIDTTAGTIVFYKNGASQGTITNAGITPNTLFPVFVNNSTSGSRNISANFGQRPFAYAPPTGFKSLNTTNMQALGSSAVGKAAIQANKWFDISLYGGTGTLRNVENSGFQPDMIWIKDRNAAQWHNITDSVRGAGVELFTNATNAEETNGGVASINTNGFSLINWDGANKSTDSYVAWQWKQSPTSGLNILTWTGTGVARSISHNLGVSPRFILIKQRNVTTRSWPVYHAALDNPQSAIYLDSQAASFAYTAFFNNQAPDSNNIYLGTDASVNQSGSNYIAYAWAEVPGFSKFGSFSGNGASDGPFIYTGFRPKFFLYKAFSHSSDWWLLDATRSSNNVAGNYVFPNAATAEGVESTWIDFLSNGIKIRGRTDPNTNGSDRKYIYMAFAESPFGLNNRAR